MNKYINSFIDWPQGNMAALRHIYTTFTLHPRSRSEHPRPSSDEIKTSELTFRVNTYPSLCPRFLSRTSVSELVATCNNFLGCKRLNSSQVVQCACSKPPVRLVDDCRPPKWPWPWMTSDPSLGCSINKTRSGARTRTRARMLGQCKCKCALKSSH